MSSKKRKPRTISEALQRWADSIHDTEPMDYMSISSVIIDGDTIYHYGNHFPMAKIVRKLPKDADTRWKKCAGKVEKVYLNTAHWGGSGGFGYSTNSLVSELGQYLRTQAGYAGIEVIPMRLCAGHSGPVMAVESKNDPEPIIPDLNIPVCPSEGNLPVDPGPKPIKDDDGCLAGQTIVEDEKESIEVEYGTTSWRPYNPDVPSYLATTNYRQCPHCAAYENVLDMWSVRTHGGKRYIGSMMVKNRVFVNMGWNKYQENLALFGDRETWRHARSSLYKLRKQRQKEHAEWIERNSMPFNAVPVEVKGNVQIPRLDRDDRVSRRALAAYRKATREARKRHEQQIEREKQQRAEYRRKMQEVRDQWEKDGVTPAESIDPRVIDWLATHGLTPNPDGRTVTLVKRLDTTEDGLRPRCGNRHFLYPNEGYVMDEEYKPDGQCGAGLHWSATFAEATEVFYGDTMIEADVDLESMQVMIWGNKVKAQWAIVKRIVPVEEWQAAQEEVAA